MSIDRIIGSTLDRAKAQREQLGSLDGLAADDPAPDQQLRPSHMLTLVDLSQADPAANEPPVIDGVAFAGRWTSISASAKQGKSEYTLNMAIHLVNGRDPYTRRPRDTVTSLYLDAEMGNQDIRERLDALEIPPHERAQLLYSDMVPKLDQPDGARELLTTVDHYDVKLVIIDGVNGAVSGSENDDQPWRDLFDHTVQPLKRRGVAVITNDNLGKDTKRGPRGSSVKLDKPDAVLILSRGDGTITLRADRRRTSAYPDQQHLRVDGIDGDRPITYTPTVAKWPAGTSDVAALLDELGVDIDAGRPAARALLTAARENAGTKNEADRYRVRDSILAAALKWRQLSLAGLIGES